MSQVHGLHVLLQETFYVAGHGDITRKVMPSLVTLILLPFGKPIGHGDMTRKVM